MSLSGQPYVLPRLSIQSSLEHDGSYVAHEISLQRLRSRAVQIWHNICLNNKVTGYGGSWSGPALTL